VKIKLPDINSINERENKIYILTEIFNYIKKLTGLTPGEIYFEIDVPKELIIIEFFLEEGNVYINIDFKYTTLSVTSDVKFEKIKVGEYLRERFKSRLCE
jgi:uncharacterized secreted protein with C-terminal beta-propeller domain